jgi:hypothetical protein
MLSGAVGGEATQRGVEASLLSCNVIHYDAEPGALVMLSGAVGSGASLTAQSKHPYSLATSSITTPNPAPLSC